MKRGLASPAQMDGFAGHERAQWGTTCSRQYGEAPEAEIASRWHHGRQSQILNAWAAPTNFGDCCI
jgi:hypothetical protein